MLDLNGPLRIYILCVKDPYLYRCMSIFIHVAGKKASEKPATEIKTSDYDGASHYRIWRLF